MEAIIAYRRWRYCRFCRRAGDINADANHEYFQPDFLADDGGRAPALTTVRVYSLENSF